MSWIVHENDQLFVDLNQYAGRLPVLDSLMVFGANDLIFFFPLLLLWGRPAFLRRRALCPGEEDIIRARRATCTWSCVAAVLALAFNLGLSRVLIVGFGEKVN